jgi:NADH dehydrogenase [ubiquinone] 1 alpha subcomplex assembly factor 7
MSLKASLAELIAAHGPLSVAQYMDACLHDPRDGYYATRPALGKDGDFITAPLVSQMFGELIGLWAVAVWRQLGSPARFRLVEVGPGDGTLIGDLLRASRLDPGFLAAMDLWLVEPSEPLRLKQQASVGAAGATAQWTASLDNVAGAAPLILIANELLDCLPARQFVRTQTGWAERMVGLDAAGELTFGLAPSALPGALAAPVGAVLELSAAQEAFAATAAERLVRDGGCALLIDYGRDAAGFADTLQALKRHQRVPVLEEPGAADLTVHADFPAVLAAARRQGAATALASQAAFLRRLGIDQRAAALSRAGPQAAAKIARQLSRLVDDDQMGLLFKAACLYYPPSLSPPGFEDD